MTSTPSIKLETPVVQLHHFGIPRLGVTYARQLATALAAINGKSDIQTATVEDLLNYLPSRYEDRSNMAQIKDLRDGLETSLELWTRVAGGFQVGRNRGPKQPKLYIFEVTASDPAGTGKPVVIWWFISGRNAQSIIGYNRKRFERGSRFVAFGQWEWDSRRNTFSLRLNKPDELEMLPGSHFEEDAELIALAERAAANADETHSSENGAGPDSGGDEDELDDSFNPALAAVHVGRRVPIYRKLGPFRTKRLRELTFEVLSRLKDEDFLENLPADMIRGQKLIGRAQAFRRIHFPETDTSLDDYNGFRSPAHYRFIFEEFFWVSLALGLRRRERTIEPKGALIKLGADKKRRIASVLPFPLTGAQSRVVKRIFEDMQSDAPMNLLLQGDVGSGKTIVAVLAMLAAMENGYQSALMAPTEILAEQHSRNIKRLVAETNFRVEMLTGSMRAAEKRRLQSDLASGEIHGIVGTHALIQDKVDFAKLGLVVIDEQHRFGVLQRAELRARGFNPDVLVMTATPIPRSLAMTAYGDLDVAVIDELPPGRTPIKTVVCGEDKRSGVYKGLEREVRAGRQAYIVYPLVEESEKLDLKDATRMFEHLRDRVFPQFSVGLLHGKMKPAEKEDVMRRFSNGEIQILVATTVVEVGVDVPNASLMVVEHAERFGLSQLHQLRGRVGRGAEQSFCVLMASDAQTSVAQERLGIMEETNDGFRIAEKDLEIRGPGEVMGTRQSGLVTFKVGNLIRDIKILETAKKEAELYLSTHRESVEADLLVKRVRSDPKFGLASVG